MASFSLMAAVALAGCGQTPSSTGPPTHLDRKTIEFGAGVTAEFVYIDAPRVTPDGFLMGSPVDQVGHRAKEPQFRAVLTQGYWLQTTEVTQEQWESVMGTNPSQLKGGRNHPVEMVSWEDCQVFIGHLRRRGLAARLPTEAEWEFACRARTTTAFSFGDGIAQASEYAWFGDNSGRERINSAAVWASSADAEAYERAILATSSGFVSLWTQIDGESSGGPPSASRPAIEVHTFSAGSRVRTRTQRSGTRTQRSGTRTRTRKPWTTQSTPDHREPDAC